MASMASGEHCSWPRWRQESTAYGLDGFLLVSPTLITNPDQILITPNLAWIGYRLVGPSLIGFPELPPVDELPGH